MLLTLGFLVVAILLVLVIAAATQVHLERMRLTHVADEVALDAADALDVDAYYGGELDAPADGSIVSLSPGALTEIAEDRLGDAVERAGLPPTELVSAQTDDGFTATVTLRTVVHPLFGIDALLPFADGVTLTATSSARAY
jgi:hypothetical protein